LSAETAGYHLSEWGTAHPLDASGAAAAPENDALQRPEVVLIAQRVIGQCHGHRRRDGDEHRGRRVGQLFGGEPGVDGGGGRAGAQDAVKGDRTGEGVDEFAHLVPVQVGQPEVVVAEHDRMRHIRQAGGVSQGFDSLRG
jgi:hypothetical protein